MQESDNSTRFGRRAIGRPNARPSSSRTSAEEALMRARVDRAQLEQGRLFHAALIEEAGELHEELRVLHEELREIYRNLHGLRRRFPSLPAVPRPAGVPPMVVAPVQAARGPRPAAGQATA